MVSSPDPRLTALEGKITALESKVTSLESQASGIQTNVTGINANLTVIKNIAQWALGGVTLLGILGAIAAVGGGLYTLFRANGAIDKAIADQVPTMIEERISESFPDDVVNSTQKINEALAKAEELTSSSEAIASAQELQDKLARFNAEPYVCEWVDIGYEKSHERIGEWCPAGSFVAQLDLDADESRPQGSSPVISSAYCCAP